MSKKLIISEIEKKEILSLYETVKKVLSISPPPSESEFVVRKNPWKNDEYLSARRFYNPSLKNDDLFCVVVGDDNLLYNILLENIKKNLNGKTIKENDIFYTFGKDISIERINFRDIKTLQPNDSLIESITIKVPKNFRGNVIWETDNLTLDLIKNTFSYWSKDIHTGKYDYTDYTSSGWMKNITDFVNNQTNSTTLKSLPDDFFEIRKIQRQKTDF
jgi:hypothetical protein